MRLIDADALLEKMSTHCDICQYHSHRKHACCRECDWHEAMDEVDDMDDVKAEPARSSKWTTERDEIHNGEWHCAECGYIPIVMTDDMEFCPGCGARMEMGK